MGSIGKWMLAVLFVCVTSVAAALELGDAKQQGMVGEKLDGYLGIVQSSPSADLRNLVEEVNAARRQKYEEIAKQNGTSVETVEVLAGEKAIEKTQAGHYVQTATGWKKK